MKQEIIRKLSAAVAMSLVVGVSLAACGGSSSSTAAGVTTCQPSGVSVPREPCPL